MRTLLIDDEPLARKELRGLLAAHPKIEIIGEAANATEATKLANRLQPDLVFLDIEMPGRSGFEWLEQLPPPHPAVVFVTAYDAFALRAFEVNALDYLLKPVHPRRLAETIVRLENRLAEAANSHSAVSDSAPNFREDDPVFVREGQRCWFVPVREIILLESEGNHTRLWFHDVKPLLPRSLANLEARLPAGMFLRANRFQLVNRYAIERAEPWFSGNLKATLRGGHTVEFSRRQARILKERLSL